MTVANKGAPRPRTRLAIRRFTTSEAAFICGLGKTTINNLIDELAPLEVVSSGNGARSIGYQGLWLMLLLNQLQSWGMQPDINRKILDAACNASARKKSVDVCDKLAVRIDIWRDAARKRMLLLFKAEEDISTDSGILGGEPCIRNTRVPARLIADLAKSASLQDVRAAYPSLSETEINSACIYAEAHPRKGRPKTIADALTKKVRRRTKTFEINESSF